MFKLYNVTKEITIETDSSQRAVKAIITQKWRPIYYLLGFGGFIVLLSVGFQFGF